MASRRIPDSISQFRPGPCTEIKEINGHYYVYMYSSIQLPSGKWGKKTGKCIGTIIPEKGFIPNKNFGLYQEEYELQQEELTVLEYGQYALAYEVAKEIRESLEKHFPLDRAAQIFAYACILFVNGFTHVDQIRRFYEQSWLSWENRNFAFKMGRTALGTLLDDLGRRTTRVTNYERAAVANSSSMAIDGHAIRCCSAKNDLGEAGYKFCTLKEDQVNLLMGYDTVTGMPLFARMYRGSCNDSSTIPDLFDLLQFSGILFVVDRGFYSKENLELFSVNENTYIIPVPANTNVFKEVMTGVKYSDSFYYRSGRKHARIEYMERRISETEYVYVFRDIDENEKCRFNYQRSIDLGKSGYTQEKLEQSKELFGVYVLQSNSGLSAEQVFAGYKKRWGIETFYQYLKNKGDFNDLMVQDYYKEQGFSFIMLIAGQIHQSMVSAIKELNNNTLSVDDILLMSRCLKMERRGNIWNLKNARKKDLQILQKLGFQPCYAAPV